MNQVYQKTNTYREVITKMTLEGKLNYRYEMVKFALAHSKKEAAREFNTSPLVIRKWVKRYKQGGIRSLLDLSRKPLSSPNKCSEAFEKKVVDLRLKTRHKFSAKRLKDRFALKHSKNCIQRIINQNHLKKKRKTKSQKRNELWSSKRLSKVFDKIQIDVKVLTDIPQYWNVYNKQNLPTYEFTARDVKTGASFVCYAYKNNSANAATFCAYLLSHLKRHGFDVKNMVFQMDNGSEFFACGNKLKGKTPVQKVIEDNFSASISRIPPASPTFNSDVETFHRLVEDEFYAIEDISDLPDLIKKAYTFLIDFNFLRKNSYKDNKTPFALANEDHPNFPLQAFNLTPIILDHNQHLYFSSNPRPSLSHKRRFINDPLTDAAFINSLKGWGVDLLGDSVFVSHDIPRGGYYLPGLDISVYCL